MPTTVAATFDTCQPPNVTLRMTQRDAYVARVATGLFNCFKLFSSTRYFPTYQLPAAVGTFMTSHTTYSRAALNRSALEPDCGKIGGVLMPTTVAATLDTCQPPNVSLPMTQRDAHVARVGTGLFNKMKSQGSSCGWCGHSPRAGSRLRISKIPQPQQYVMQPRLAQIVAITYSKCQSSFCNHLGMP